MRELWWAAVWGPADWSATSIYRRQTSRFQHYHVLKSLWQYHNEAAQYLGLCSRLIVDI
jgi:hypothetical protein